MSYWPALLWPSWNAFAKNESYGCVRNWIEIPVCFLKSGMIFCLNGTSAPSSNAPITSFLLGVGGIVALGLRPGRRRAEQRHRREPGAGAQRRRAAGRDG